jgi:hypothetical protein
VKGADVMAVGNNGRMPIHHTAQVSLGDAIWALVENSIDVRAVDKDGRTDGRTDASPSQQRASHRRTSLTGLSHRHVSDKHASYRRIS